MRNESAQVCWVHPWVKGIQVYSNEGPCPFPRGDNYEIAKIHWQNLKIFFSRTTGPILTKLGTKYSWVKWIQVCTNEGFCFFQKDIIAKLWKYINKFEKASSPEPLGQFSTKVDTNHPWVNVIQVCSNEGLCPFPGEDNYEIVKIHWRF